MLDGKDSKYFDVSAIMSIPRLVFTDNMFCCIQALQALEIPLRKTTGAFWGQCMERGILQILAAPDCPDALLTIDYDTVFTQKHVEALIDLLRKNPDVDAVAPLQMGRERNTPLFVMATEPTITGTARPVAEAKREVFDAELVPILTAHFGLTLIRTAALRKMSKPWFYSCPAPDMSWGEGRVDDDVHFWNVFRAAGNKLCLAPRVAIGHLELMVNWPDANMEPLIQRPSEFWAKGPPPEVWR